MGRGGARKGSGRKRGVPNLTTQELRDKINGAAVIASLQDIAFGLVDATVGERLTACRTLLSKLLADAEPIGGLPQNSPPSMTRAEVEARARALVATRDVALKKPTVCGEESL